eukprot:110152-Pleurochrysis_carterae.AAC.2
MSNSPRLSEPWMLLMTCLLVVTVFLGGTARTALLPARAACALAACSCDTEAAKSVRGDAARQPLGMGKGLSVSRAMSAGGR